MARFLLATMALDGHFNPGIPIAQALLNRGHEVSWYTSEDYRGKVERRGFRFFPMVESDRSISCPPGISGVTGLKFDMKHLFIAPIPLHVRGLREILRGFPADAIVHDTGFLAAGLLSEMSGIPHATFGVTVLTIASRDTPPFGLGLLPMPSWTGRLRNRVLYQLLKKIIFREVQAHYHSVRRELGLPVDKKRDFFDSALGPYLYLQGSVPSFEYPRGDLPPQVHFIGPLLPSFSGPFNPPVWWDDLRSGRPVVHVTQGTVATQSCELIEPTLQVLADEDVWVLATTGGAPVERLRALAPHNARVESFLSYAELLPHVQTMVTNGGYGGVQWALAHGVPLIVAGKTEDKPEVANRIAWSGTGVNLRTRNPTAAQIKTAYREVVDNPAYRKRARDMQVEIAGYDAPARAASLLEELARTGRPIERASRASDRIAY